MNARILILGAGTGAANNLVRSLKTGDSSIITVGVQSDRFSLCRSTADRKYLVPRLEDATLPNALLRVIRREGIDLIFPNTDAEVELTSRLRDELPCRVFLPRESVIELCMDKYRLGTFLRERGISAPLTYPIEHLDEVEQVWAKFDRPVKLWCRMRAGAGSVGALPAVNPAQVRAWISYWQDVRGVPLGFFTLSEYLPGRDFACQTLWKDGRIVLLKTVERLAYFGGTGHPSGVSSIAAIAKTVDDARVASICEAAVRAVDQAASGAFSLDLKEDATGIPCITEINVGRFITMMNFFDFVGAFNMSTTYVKLALGEPVEITDPHDFADDYYFMRDVDTTPTIVHVDKLFEDIETV